MAQETGQLEGLWTDKTVRTEAKKKKTEESAAETSR